MSLWYVSRDLKDGFFFPINCSKWFDQANIPFLSSLVHITNVKRTCPREHVVRLNRAWTLNDWCVVSTNKSTEYSHTRQEVPKGSTWGFICDQAEVVRRHFAAECSLGGSAALTRQRKLDRDCTALSTRWMRQPIRLSTGNIRSDSTPVDVSVLHDQ